MRIELIKEGNTKIILKVQGNNLKQFQPKQYNGYILSKEVGTTFLSSNFMDLGTYTNDEDHTIYNNSEERDDAFDAFADLLIRNEKLLQETKEAKKQDLNLINTVTRQDDGNIFILEV